MNNNTLIRTELKRTGLRYWELARILGISDATLCRRLRDELPAEEQRKICQLINQRCGGTDYDQRN